MTKLESFKIDELIELVKQSNNFADLVRKLGYKTATCGNIQCVRNFLVRHDISFKHFKVNTSFTKRTVENVFIENSTATQKVLRVWYKKGKYSEYKCDICGMFPIWQGKPLTLILDHKNGNNRDNRLENLHWVCPNCNQQLPTTGYHGKNKMNLRSHV